MISLPGRLVVKIINGRNGAFRVGNLQTDIGDFSVKDKILDQYDEGSYEGLFDISKISSATYSIGSRLVVEVRAILENVALANAEKIKPDQFTSLEQDPLDEDVKNSPIPETSTPAVLNEEDERVSVNSDQIDHSESDPDKQLFGLLWPLKDTFKLDPTVDRAAFRLQRERLKALGYQFKPIGQCWVKP